MKNAFSIIFLLLISCFNENEKPYLVIDPLQTVRNEKSLSDYANEIKYIALRGEIPVQHILDIEISDSLLFVGTYPYGILAFNYLGKFQHHIGRIGHGPFEYKNSSTFSIDRNNRLVYVLNGDTIYVFTFEGERKKTISIGYLNSSFNRILFKDDILYLFEYINCGHARYDWVLIDTNGQLIEAKPNYISDFKSRWGGRGFVSENQDKIFYFNQYNDTLFCIQERKHKVAYLFQQGDFRWPKSDFEQLDRDLFTVAYFCCTKNGVFFSYYFNRGFHLVEFGDKIRNGQIISTVSQLDNNWGGPGIKNDLDNGVDFIPRKSHQLNGINYFSDWAFAYQIREKANSELFYRSISKFPEKKKELEALANRLNDNDNPVLMLVKLKE